MGTVATLSERDARIAAIRQAMAVEGLDALIIGGKGHWWTGRGYVRYLTDFHFWGHDALILLPADGPLGIVVTSYAVANMVAERGWIEDAGGDVFLLPRLLELVGDRGLERSKIGTVGTPSIISADLMRELEESLPHAQLVAADHVFDTVRAAKSAVEIAQNRELWQVARTAMERFVEILRPGVPARELAAEATRVAMAAGVRDALVLMGDRSDVYAPPTPNALRMDDLVRFHMEPCGESGHWCELTVTLAFRELSESEERLMATELDAKEAVRKAARPGVTLGSLARCYDEALRAANYEFGEETTHFDFHGQGLDVIEAPWFAAAQPWGSTGDAELQSGAILSYHPRRNVLPGVAWSTGMSDDLLITDTGSEWLSGDWEHSWWRR